MDRHGIKRQAVTEKNVPKINSINDDILCHILIFLPLKQAVRTSILARSWRNLWKFNPNLIIEYINNLKIHKMPNSNTIISNILDSHKTKLQCCQICHTASDLNEGRVHQWITRLKESHHVQDLTLKLYSDYEDLRRGDYFFDHQLSLPSKLFGSQTLQVLKLGHYALRDASAFKGCVNLTTLKLHNVKLFSSRKIAEIISNCPQLTKLSLTQCVESVVFIWKNLAVCSDKLEYLELRQNTNIRNLHIDCIKLRTLVLEFLFAVRATYINTPALTSFQLLDKFGARFLRYTIGLWTHRTFSFRQNGLENLHCISVFLGLSYQDEAELLCRIFQVCIHLKELNIVNYHVRKDWDGSLPQEYDGPCLFWDNDKIEGSVPHNLRALEVSMFRADPLEMEFIRYVMSYAHQMELLLLRYHRSCSRQVIDAANKILLAHPRASGTAAIRLRLDES